MTTLQFALLACVLLALVAMLFWWRVRERLARLREATERLQISLWAGGYVYWDWDFLTDTIQRSGEMGLHGSNSEGRMSGAVWRSEALHPDDLPAVELTLRRHMAGETKEFVSEHRLKSKSGDYIWVRSRGKITSRDALGNPWHMSGIAVDITTARATMQELLVAQEALNSIAEGVVVLEPNGKVVTVNPAFERMSRYQGTDLNFFDLASARATSELLPELVARTLDLGGWSGELWLKRASAEDFYASCEFSLIPPRAGETAHIVVTLNDLSERKRAEIEVSHLTNFDALTNLPNRTMLMNKLQRAVLQAQHEHKPMALIFLNVDRFTQFNESWGQALGDELLRTVALRLAANAAEHELVGRFGGDEFAILLPEVDSIDHALARCNQLRKVLVAPMQLTNAEISPTASCGVAISPDHGDSADSLLKAAVTAMQVAKALGGDAIYLANTPDDSARERILLEQQLRRALERDEFYLAYQPIYSLHNNCVSRFEALLRWRHAERGLVPPSTFIPILEGTGQIAAVGEWVLETALQQLAEWRGKGYQGGMSVNVSPVQLVRSDILDILTKQLAKWHLPGEALELEITESSVMSDAEASISLFKKLQAMGVSIAIDDFGTGYSSLSYLRRLPIKKLKIDQSFIRDLSDDAEDLSIVDTILAMAKALNLETVAEGVETAQQLAHLRAHGCHAVQGFLIAKPLPAAEAENWIHGSNAQVSATLATVPAQAGPAEAVHAQADTAVAQNFVTDLAAKPQLTLGVTSIP